MIYSFKLKLRNNKKINRKRISFKSKKRVHNWLKVNSFRTFKNTFKIEIKNEFISDWNKKRILFGLSIKHLHGKYWIYCRKL